MELKITINTKGKGEAYNIASLLKMQHDVTEVTLDGEAFEFTQKRDKAKIEKEAKNKEKKTGKPSKSFY